MSGLVLCQILILQTNEKQIIQCFATRENENCKVVFQGDVAHVVLRSRVGVEGSIGTREPGYAGCDVKRGYRGIEETDEI